MTSIKLDGIKMRLQVADYDGDGITGETETIQQQAGSNQINIQDTSELGEAMGKMNEDVKNADGFSSVDFVSNINSFQIAPMVALEMMANLKVVSSGSQLVRNLMRKSVSLTDAKSGVGRSDYVKAVTSKLENEMRKASASNLMGKK
jgi:hypothetical protein